MQYNFGFTKQKEFRIDGKRDSVIENHLGAKNGKNLGKGQPEMAYMQNITPGHEFFFAFFYVLGQN